MEAMALGDAENDVEMLSLVGTGAAMGNANEAAKRAADVVVGMSHDDGVAEAVRRFVLGVRDCRQERARESVKWSEGTSTKRSSSHSTEAHRPSIHN